MAGVGFAIAGTVLAAGGLANSFVQARKQNKLRREAEDQAAESLEAARKILGVNKLEGLSAPLRVYEEARQGVRQTSANVIDAARQGEARGVGSVAQQTLNASQNAERQISATQEQEILRLQELAAREDSRLQSGLANLEMMGVAGAQQAARDAQMSEMKAVSEGFEGLTKLGKTVVDYKNELIPLFQNKKGQDFSSVGGVRLSENAIAANPTLYGQYQGQNVFLPETFKVTDPMFDLSNALFETPAYKAPALMSNAQIAALNPSN